MEMNSWSFWLRNWWRLKPKPRKSSDINETQYTNNDREDDEQLDENEVCYCDECNNGDIDLCSDPSDGIDSDGSMSSNSGKQVIVGVCAMSKKSQSKPMKEILTRLQEFEYIRIVVFLEEVILKEPVDLWPICDCLISFHSKGFPLDKAIQYALLRKPYVINNLHMQYDIQDRRKVYSILESEGIEIPRYAVLDRDSPDPKQHELVESEDHVEVNGVIFNKPFVEKPVSAEDHNIYIYYPTSAGGGSQRLFRKIGSRSSVYSPESRVRKTGSFIYEDFMPTDGTDVKVYTVGPDYAHAEARKSPALDGKVERDSEGKEIRYPVILSNAEKLISRKVCLAFKQTVCGFDLLRANGKSYVCDVNGFSFVKNSNKYYDDCAKILGNMILRELAPTLHIPWSVPFQLDDPPIVPTTFGKMMELRCVVAIIRHGDRTPKQKMKVEVRHQKFFEIFEKYNGYKHGHIKLKRPKQLQEILDIARSLLTEIQTKAADNEIEEKQGKLEQLKSVLEMYGHFSGINRKVQMKYQPKGRPPRGSSSDDGNISSNGPKDPSLVLILKWGGELTPAGRIQAEELGRIFRCMYPGGQGRNEYSGTQGLGLLRLHSTFRHDLKIYASDEGRVQMTAAAFAKGLLALEGELTPILVQMVKSANTNGLLDNDCDSSKYQNMAKNRLHDLMQIDRDFTLQDREAINPGNSISINQAMDFVKNPVKCCAHVHLLIQSLLAIVIIKRDDQKTREAILYHGETWELMGRRWGKIEKDFSTKSKTFDISKIPDIYDCIKYDLQHNQHTLQFEQAEELYIYAKYLADIVIPQEYGLTKNEKLTIGQGICVPLLKKIKADLQRNIEEVGDESVNRLNPRYSHGVSSPGRHVRTRLYFTSESHVHSLLTVLRYGGLADIMTDEQWRRAMEYVSMVSELNYMSQIVIMLYEDPTKDPCSEERFHVELHFSPGVNCCVQKNLPPGPGFRPHSRNDSGTSKNASGEEEGLTTRIEEENDLLLEEDFGSIHTTVRASSESPKSPSEDCSPSEFMTLPKVFSKTRHTKSSNPITIGSHHTVSGHEAMDLAKRLNQELASQLEQQQAGSLGSQRTLSPDTEPRARSFEQKHPKPKDKTMGMASKTNIVSPDEMKQFATTSLLYDTDSATNELPLSSIKFSVNPLSPTIYEPLDNPLTRVNDRPLISTLATNERPLSSTPLSFVDNDDDPTKTTQFMSTLTKFDNEDSLNNSIADSIPIIREQLQKNTNVSDSICRVETTAPITICRRHSVSSTPITNFNKNDEFKAFDSKIFYDNNNILMSSSIVADFNKNKHLSCSFINNNNTKNITENNYKDLTFQSQTILPQSLYSSTSSERDFPSISLKNSSNGNITTIAEKTANAICTFTSAIITTTTSITTTTTITTGNTLCANNPTIPHPNIVKLNNSDSAHTSHHTTSSSSSSAVRRQRHSIAGQINYFKLLGFGGFNKKMTTSANSLFSTAVITGSSSAPNLRDMIPITSPSVLEGFGGVPPIRPLETLHNALSLKQIDAFLEKMTTAHLSPPKYPSTPVPTPIQTPQNSRSTAQLSWSGQSSMTSSTSALSSEGPSSPIISDVYSRGCPSSDMSASLISNDGMGVLGATSEFSQMFPVLDYDLSSVGAQLTLDQIEGYRMSGSNFLINTENSEDLTPISASSDWEFNTNDATHGSMTNLCTEEEEEETTLSTDTCLSASDFGLPTEQLDLKYYLNSSIENFESLCTKTKKNSFCDSISSMPGTSKDFDAISDITNIRNNIVSTSGTPKIENKFRNSNIQKQIYLYEKDTLMEHKNFVHDVGKFSETTANMKSINTIKTPKLISASDLEKSVIDIEKNLNSTTLENQKEKCTKTKSCVNLISNPGAVLIKESFIEPPKRIAKSFHGKTQFSNLELLRRSSEQQPSSSGFIPPKVSNIKTLRRQYSTPNSSISVTRFKTTLVRESLPSQSVDDEALDNACSLEDEKNINNSDDNK